MMYRRIIHTTSTLTKCNIVTVPLRMRHKLNQQHAEKEARKPALAADVVKFLDSSSEYTALKEQLPRSLLKKYKNPESMYLISKKSANEIANTIKPYLDDSPVVEVNPGLGLLSKELLQVHKNPHFMYEISPHFLPYLSKLKEQYPDRVSVKVADFFGMWKLAFQDKLDQGTRIKDLLGDLATQDDDRIVKVVGAMPSLSFMKHLIHTIVFHNLSHQMGRPDLFMVMPGSYFEFLTDSKIQLSKYKSVPALFQMLFDYKVLSTVPKAHFLPWTTPGVSTKHSNVVDDNCLRLVNITQKERLPCPPDYLPLFWYFFKPQVFAKSTRVIPMLEQWIPGCGVWLITGQDPPDTRTETAPGPDDAPLPHMTIFTEFGDLSLQQKITVFKKFISWPEFEQCQFRVTMENNLPKFVSQIEDDDKDGVVAPIDIDHSDSECEHIDTKDMK